MLDLDALALWPHQRAAVDMGLAYLDSGSTRSALVHLPTGSGKTGVMATVARLAAETKPALILCPSAALARQLESQIAGAFWARMNADAEWSVVRTERLLESRLDEVLAEINRANAPPLVVISTIQALQDVHGEGRHEELVDAFSVVFFDEGHREPAPQWAKAARDLRAPMILLSATPYRNDFKLFDVDPAHISFLAFSEAVAGGLIRPVEIEELALADGATAFAAQVIARRDAWVADGAVLPDHKMIVRAESEAEVRALFEAFRARLGTRDDGVLAIHYQFEDDGTAYARTASGVPADLADRPERFLIHQNMLIEGVDDPACSMLALYSAFGNERQLVQQIGRLTRHPGPTGTVVPPARILARTEDRVGRMWGRFLAFDQACVDNGGRPPLRDDGFVDNLVAATPSIDYLDGQFRSRVDFTDVDLSTEIRTPRSAIVYDTADDFDLADLLDALDDALVDEDRFTRASYLSADGRTAYRLSVKLRQSPFLAESLFQSATLELTLVSRVGSRLYYYDSAGLSVDDLPGLSNRIGPKAIGTLLPRQSRVEFADWCEGVNAVLDAGQPSVDLFNRFATPAPPPADTTPLNILIDLDPDADRFRDADGVLVRFDIESLCVDVQADASAPRGYGHSFEMTINEEAVTVYIRWDAKKRKYWLLSQELSRIHDADNAKVTLAARLNRTQPFRIILAGSTVFAYGQFYSLDLKLGQASGPGALVLGLMTGLKEMTGLVLEKGALTAAATTWPADSLFGVIDRALAPAATARPFGDPFSALVCDDIGDEAADFIGVDDSDDGRTAFILAKWKKGKPGAGASALYDVCGQAQKNLAYLKTDGQKLPGARDRFNDDWSLNGGLVPRRRYGPGSVGFRSLFAKVRARPNARREIWLVLGQGILSRKAVVAGFKANPPEPHVLQLFHLLLSTHSACQSVGVELKIFCAD